MKTVKQKIKSEVEYLTALAALYEQEGDEQACRATVAAIEALRQLLDVIHHPARESAQDMPVAA